MLIVKVEGKLTIEKALKVLKKKWDKTKAMKEIRNRKEEERINGKNAMLFSSLWWNSYLR